MMNYLLSAKGGDVTSWRAVEDFAARYRQMLLDRIASGQCGDAADVLRETCAMLETMCAAHQDLVQHLELQRDEITTAPLHRLKNLTIAFYSDLYRHFSQFRSAPIFFEQSMLYLRDVSAVVIRLATEQLGPHAGNLPEITLAAVGPAGRGEYSPFCPLQLLLIHGEAGPAQLTAIEQLCHALHAGFEAAGLTVDPLVTPRSERWRGTLTEWRKRGEEWLQSHGEEELIDLNRLVDLTPLYPAEGAATELRRSCRAVLGKNRPALATLVKRMMHLSNGLGIMGRLKLERYGSERSVFLLLDHGLLPLSAALSVLGLITEIESDGSCELIRDLLQRRELDVEMAERMLEAWHYLNGRRLQVEQAFHLDDHAGHALLLKADEMTAEQRQMLKDALEAVASIQRHVEIIFSGTGE